MTKGFKVLARHRWVAGATITESCNIDDSIRRFTATIRGWRNFCIYEGKLHSGLVDAIITRVKSIRDAIDRGDEGIFYQIVQLSNDSYYYPPVQLNEGRK